MAAIVFIGTLSMVVIYYGLNVLKKAMHELAEVNEPISAAAYEIEINLKGLGLSILNYLENGNPIYRTLAEDSSQDFEHFHARYLHLARTQGEQTLGEKLGGLFHALKRLGYQLMAMRDQQEALLADFSADFEKINTLIDHHVQTSLALQEHLSLQKPTSFYALESDVAEMGFWLLRHQRSQKPQDKQLLLANMEEFRTSLDQLQGLHLSAAEHHWTRMVEASFNRAVAITHQLLSLEEQLQTHIRQFVHLQLEIDALVDDEIQTQTMAALFAPRIRAERETEQIRRIVFFLMPLLIVAVISVALLLIRSITRPVKLLIRGTQAVSQGALDYRVGPLGSDEFGELAAYFDHMVADLQATTVSKALLQESEAKLQATVEDLRREIMGRERAEAERAQLQDSLQRHAIMAAMGSLVAGVAHQVRNPLFAISSTLDAFEARFTARQEYARYLGVLRTEVQRLIGLMQDLLEYGKPLQLDLVPDALDEVVAQALRACMPLARRQQVHVLAPERHHPGLLPMHRQRLEQAFQNLIENAIQHSPPEGRVILEVKKESVAGHDYVACVIKDAGPGFRPEDLPKVFEPFFTRRRGGTGLGMSIARRIVEEHGGRIVADNRPEGGAMIVVHLPLMPLPMRAGANQEDQHGAP